MGWFSGLFSDNPTSIVEAVRDIADDAWYTDEEAAKDRREFTFKWLESTTNQAKARRILAFAITFSWLGMYVFSVIGRVLGSGWFYIILDDQEKAKLVTESMAVSANELLNAAITLNPYMTPIIMYYFAAQHIDKGVSFFIEGVKNFGRQKKN